VLTKTKTAVVILNWNGKEFLKKFLPGVIKFTHDDGIIIVADNNSDDDSVAMLTSNFNSVDIIRNESNGGFATGYNLALQKINSEYYVLLNNMPGRQVVSSIFLVIRFVRAGYSRISRRMITNTTSVVKSSGPVVPVW